MLWLVFTTGACNLRCTYCGGSFEPPHVVPWRVTYDINKLRHLVENDKDATVIFYGGEPLLNPGFIMRVMDNVKARRFGIQQMVPSLIYCPGIIGVGWMSFYYQLMAGRM